MEAFGVVMVEQTKMKGYSPLLLPVKETNAGDELSPKSHCHGQIQAAGL